MILTGDLNCRSSQWWDEDTEYPEGIAFNELVDMNNLYQLIDKPTNIRVEGMSCIDLLITDQPKLFIESSVHPSLDSHCQHQIIHGKLNILSRIPPPYQRIIWDYSKKLQLYLNVMFSRTNVVRQNSSTATLFQNGEMKKHGSN